VPIDAGHLVTSSITETNYTDCGNVYNRYYAVTAVNENGESAPSNEDRASASCGSAMAITLPVLNATALTESAADPVVTKYYFAGGKRVAMDRDGVVQYLATDHLGSTSLVLDDQGSVVAESRHYPYGEERWRWPQEGTFPTEYRFTGQKLVDSAGGTYHMGARFYDSALGRWISADTLVPEPGSPQSFNRYAYALGNPLRFVDPTGYYSEDEIMLALEVETWDEVLAMFQLGGVLEGLWGWLEILRRADDGDMVMWGALQGTTDGQSSIGALPQNMGFFRRDDAGHILVGSGAHTEFAAEGRGYTYSLFKSDSDTVYSTGSSWWWSSIHPRVVLGEPDWVAVRGDVASVLAEAIGWYALKQIEVWYVSVPVAGVCFGISAACQSGSTLEGGLNILAYPQRGKVDSSDVLGVLGPIPGAGLIADLLNIFSNATGLRVEFTP